MQNNMTKFRFDRNELRTMKDTIKEQQYIYIKGSGVRNFLEKLEKKLEKYIKLLDNPN